MWLPIDQATSRRKPRHVLNSSFSCLNLQIVGITGLRHHTQLPKWLVQAASFYKLFLLLFLFVCGFMCTCMCFLYVSVGVWCVHVMAPMWKSGNNFGESILTLQWVWGCTQISRLVQEALLSTLPCYFPHVTFKVNILSVITMTLRDFFLRVTKTSLCFSLVAWNASFIQYNK